ncbi:uncharacterized protein LOC121989756 isoform X1 [Zingiber officinale]|uniref:uncharacterized protein LOC121989756 isoform X1 n=2 Tax=Zingiber officinale TaxID=94328 RepID=UPI001C4C651E|nr:uncharacterized protein LOC121989756 isoform X1 [Zingiber officinale]XP_042399914.1 uncharacterized protein LOC121989756 isoform X1 [Zingiber officinale]XP_042399915.1 uncharacterized protein LOC121989756 isoform X1 [Zingiber officinale]
MVRAQSQKKNAAGSSRSKGGAKKMKDLHDLGISCSMQNANPSSEISSGKGKDREEIIASSSGPKDPSPLRRSTRESLMKKLAASNSNLSKSEHLENPSSSTPLKKGRIERQVKKVDQSPLRKSERIDKSSATSSSGCKNDSKSSDSSGKKKGDAVKNEEEAKSKHINLRIPPTDNKRKQMTARSYRASLISAKKVKMSDSAETQHERDSLAADTEAVLEDVGGCCQRKISEQNVELCKGEFKEDAECSSSCSKEDSVKALGIEGGAISMKEPFHDVFQRLLDGNDNESDVCKQNRKDLFLKSREISFPDRSNRADTSRENKSSPVAFTSFQRTDYGPDMVVTPKGNDKLAQEVHTEDVCLSTSSAKRENSEKCAKCVKLTRVQVVHAKDSCTMKRINDVSFAPLEVVDQPSALGAHQNDANPMEEDKAEGTLLSKAKEKLDGAEKSSCHVPPVCTTSVDKNIEKTSESSYCHTLGSSKRHVCSTGEPLAEIQTDSDPDVCVLCRQQKTELLCRGKGCNTRYHLSCLDPPLPNAPPGIWLCISCIKKKIEFGVYSVSVGIDSVWNFKEGEQNSKQYLVKYKGLAHAHNQWISETQMLQEAPSILSKFNRDYQKNMIIRWKQEWTVPHRLLQKRLLMPQELADQFFEKLGNNFTKCYHEWYVEWKGLGYKDATWELESSQLLRTPDALLLMQDYEVRLKGKTAFDSSNADKAYERKPPQRSLHQLLKPELSKLCEILKLPENVADMAQLFLEYIMYNHQVNPEPEVILQAFKISLCWRAASFLKHKIDHEETLALAKKYLNFTCDEDQASNIYSKLRILKKKFSQKDCTSWKKRESGPPSSGADITEEPVSKMSTDSSGPNVSEPEKGARNEDPGHNVLEQLMLPEQEQDPGCATHADLQEHSGSRNDELIRNQTNSINKICSRREADLSVKQNEEILDFNKHKEKMEMSLKKEHEKRIEPFLAMINDSTERENNIRLSSENLAKKIAAFSKHMSVQYEKLKSMQSVARDKEHQIKNHWLEEAKGGKLEAVNLVDCFYNIPLSDSGFMLEEFKVLDQDDSHDSLGIGTYDSDTTGSFQNEQIGNVLSVGNLVTTERPSKNFEVAKASPEVAECLSGQRDTFITQSYSVDEVLGDLPLEVPSSVPFTDIIDVHMDTVTLASKLPVKDIVTDAVDGMPINSRIAATEKQAFDKNSERSCSRSCPSQIMDQGEHMNYDDGVCLATLSTENQEPCINEHARTDNSLVFEGQGIGTSQEIPTSNSSDILTFPDELLTNNIAVSDYFDNPLPIGRVPIFVQCEDNIAASVIEQEPSRQMSGSLQNGTPMSEPTMLSSALVSQIVDQSILQNSHMRSQSSIGEDLTNVSRQPETFRYPLFPLIQLMPIQGLQPEPLKNELARIRMQDDRIGKMHEDMKLKLKLECDQEMLKVQKKYDMLLQDAESECVQSKKTLATIYDKVFMNQVLAEEFRAKFVENQGGSSSTSQGQQRSLHHLLQASQPQFVQRAASSTISMSNSLPVTRPSAAIPLPVTRPAAANLPPDAHPSAAIPRPVTRPSATIPFPVTRPTATNLGPSAAIPLPATRPSATIPLPVTHPTVANLPPAIPLPVTRPSGTIPLSVTRPTVANLASSAAIPLPVTHPTVANLPAAIPLPVTHPSGTIPLAVTRPTVANLAPSAAIPLPVSHPTVAKLPPATHLSAVSPSAAQSNSFATIRLRAPSIPSGQTVRSPSSVFPSNSVRHHFGSMLPPRSNIQIGSETRAPAPHLQRFRANASLTSSSVIQISGTSPFANIGSTTMGQVANTPKLQPCFLPVSGTGEPVISNSVSSCQDVSSTSVGLPLNVQDIGIGASQQSSFQLANLVPTIDRNSSNFPSTTTPGLSQTSAADVDRHRVNSDVVCISDDES